MGRVARWGLWSVAGVLVVALAGLGVGLLVYPHVYLARAIFWGNSDVGDKFRFAARPLPASPHPTRFAVAPDLARVRTLLQNFAGTSDLDGFLTESKTEALLVLQDNTILYEGYFNGTTRSSLVTSFSVAKSVASALVGAALAEGKLHSLDDPVTRYLPELEKRDPRFARITLRHLLTMASGIRYMEYPFLTADDAKTYYWPDLRALALERTRIAGPPGERWLYNNYHPLLMGLVLERATGMSVTQYLNEKLWQPLEMEYEGSWSLDHGGDGLEKMESGLNARAIDFLKIGKLFLDGGRWNGRSVLPEAWTVESTTADPGLGHDLYYPGDFPRSGRVVQYYAYWWWGWRYPDGTHDYAAVGKYGQYIFVSPAHRVVMVRFGKNWGRLTPAEWLRLFRSTAEALDAPGAVHSKP